MTRFIPIKKSLQENQQTIGISGEVFSIPEVGLSVHDGATMGGVLLQERSKNSGENILRNGSFIVNQNGTSWQGIPTSGNIEYIVDGWFYHRGGGSTANAAVTTELASDLPVATKALRVTTFSGNNNNSFSIICQQISGVNLLDGQTVTISFWAKTTSSRRIAVILRQDYDNVVGTGELFLGNPSLTTDWEFYSYKITVPKAITTSAFGVNNYTGLWIWLEAGSDYDARTGGIGTQSGQTDIANVKMEIGDSATPFGTFNLENETLKVQQYYEKNFDDIFMFNGAYDDAANVKCNVYIPFVPKIKIPAVTINTNFLNNPSVLDIGKRGFNVFGTPNSASSVARVTDYIANAEILPY
jgi:hypothetical protein